MTVKLLLVQLSICSKNYGYLSHSEKSEESPIKFFLKTKVVLITKGFFMKRKFMNFFVLFLGMSGLLLQSSCKLDSRVESSSKVGSEQQGIKYKLSDLKFAIIGEKIGLPKPGEGVKNIYAVDPALGLIDNENGVFTLLNRPNGPQKIKVTSSAGDVSASKTISVTFATTKEIVEWRYKHILEEGGGLELTSQGIMCSTSANNRTDVLDKFLFSYSSSYYSPSLFLKNELSLEKLAALGLKIDWKATKGVEINTDLSKSEITITPPAQKTESEIMAQLVLKEVGSQEEVKSNKTKIWYVNVLPKSEYPKAKAEDKAKAEAEFKKARERFEAFLPVTGVMSPTYTDPRSPSFYTDIKINQAGSGENSAGKDAWDRAIKGKLEDSYAIAQENYKNSTSNYNQSIQSLKQSDLVDQFTEEFPGTPVPAALQKAHNDLQEAIRVLDELKSRFDRDILSAQNQARNLSTSVILVLKQASDKHVPFAQEYADAYEKYPILEMDIKKRQELVTEYKEAKLMFDSSYIQDKDYSAYAFIKAYHKTASDALKHATDASNNDSNDPNKKEAKDVAKKTYNEIDDAFKPFDHAVKSLMTLYKKSAAQIEKKIKLAEKALKLYEEAFIEAIEKL